MKYIWVAEYWKNRRWHYIGAQPKLSDAQNLCTAYFFKARVRRFEFLKPDHYKIRRRQV